MGNYLGLKSRHFERILPLVAPPLSALALVSGYPHYSLYLLPWIGLAPLFFALSGRSARARALISYFFGVFFFGLLFYWFCHARSPAWVGYLIFVIVIPVIFIPWGLAAGWALDRRSPFALFVPALGWAAIELLMSRGMFAFPWWSLAVSQSKNTAVLQIASLTGMYGISFLVVSCNLVLYKTLSGQGARYKIPILVTGALFALAVGYGAHSLTKREPPRRQPMRIAMVQPSFAQDEKHEAIEGGIIASLDEMQRVFWSMAMTASKHDPRPDVMVWPESVLPVQWLLQEDMSPRPEAAMLLDMTGATLISGVFIGNYNSVIGVTPEGRYLGRYDKMQLVPGGEFIPWRRELSRVPALGKWFDRAVYQDDTERGTRYHIFETEHGRLGPLICFESMAPHIARGMTRRGAEMLLVVTNDAWFKYSPAAAQHVALAQLRAVENRRWLAQASNSGLTVIIDPQGRVTASSGLFERQNIHGELYPRTDTTFYTKYGDVFAWSCAGLFAALLLGLYAAEKLNLGMETNPCGDADPRR